MASTFLPVQNLDKADEKSLGASVDGASPELTPRDLETSQQKIRERLQIEGVFTSNHRLQAPWDFNAVLVLAPEGSAGLGDFLTKARRLDAFGICRFTYAYSRFQGEGAARDMGNALRLALAACALTAANSPDAIVIVRGAGSVSEMGWLNDYDLARYLCDLPIPVLTGIGNEHDSTLLDEVAHTRFDTASKVISGIQQVIAQRAAEAKSNFEQLTQLAAQVVQSAKVMTGTLDLTIKAEARRQLAHGKGAAAGLMDTIRSDAMQRVQSASAQSRETLQVVKTQAMTQMSQAKLNLPKLWSEMTLGTQQALQTASAENSALIEGIFAQASQKDHALDSAGLNY